MTDLKTWASAGPRRVLEPGERPGTARVPFRAADREAYLRRIKGKGIPGRVEDAPVERVPLKALSAIQKTINAERLEEHLRDPDLISKGSRRPGSGMKIDKPVVVRIKGEHYLHDGHHRATAAMLKGADSIKARVVDIDEEE